jgi:hypothetical protein
MISHASARHTTEPAMRRVTYVASEKLAKVGHLRNSECLLL